MKKLMSIRLTCKILIYLTLFSPSAKAQIIPDNTLPDNSTITPQENIQQIEGGTRAGNNLFHSFEQFSVPVEQTAAFNNAVDIQNIFSRVTGNSISEIEGKIQANGAANLLLINPNGIIFGENASLDIGGSFLGSTADSIIFPDGVEFSATDTQTTPLLTITAPIGLGLNATAGDIINRSVATDSDGNSVGLQVLPEKTFALVGGNVLLEGGIITAESGRIEIGSVGEDSTVNFSVTEPGFALDYQGISEFKDIDLSALALVDASGAGGGAIQVQGRQLTLTGDSAITSTTLGSEGGETMRIKATELVAMAGDATNLSTLTAGTGKAGDLIIETGNLNIRDGAYVETSSFAEGDGGNLTVKVAESVDLIGTTSELTLSSGLFAEVNATGNGGNLTVETKNLTVSNGANISTSTFGAGKGGDLIVQAVDSVEIMGASADEVLPSGLFANVKTTGNGGNLSVDTQNLTIQDGAQVAVNTTFGTVTGNAGNLTVQAADSIKLLGTNSDGSVASSLSSQVDLSASGNAGNLNLETRELIVRDGAQISTVGRNEGQAGKLAINASDSILLTGTSSFGNDFSSSGVFVSVETGATGDAGELAINAGELTVEKGAKISANTFGQGEGSNVNLNLERLIIDSGGTIGVGSLLQGVGSTDENITNNIRGSGGEINLNATEDITITGTGNIGETLVNSSLFTKSEGTGDAGNLTINTPNLTVADGGNINVSATGTGEAGSLSIDAQELNLDRGSILAETRVGDEGNITVSDADGLLLRNNSQITTNATEQATGGDITINSDAIALLDDSDITANAEAGRGGNIDITTQGIFQEPDSDITAASELGIDGTVTLNTLDVDPTSGIYKLPEVPIDAENILAQDLCKLEDNKIAKGSSFIITGRGGLTPTSADSLSDIDRVVNWASREDLEVSQNGAVAIRQRETNNSAKDLVNKSYPNIQQSQDLVVAKDGSAWLTANAYQATSNNSGIIHPDCRTIGSITKK
jgi:filamentous hemagglutinin family protein